MDINKTLAKEFSLRQEQVDNTVELIDDGKTIPFIARYRKELTGSLDDQILRELFDRLTYLRNLEKRKEEITASITEQEKMTPEIEAAISAASTLVEVEDIYRPFKPKRKTRASAAREKGLEPLAEVIISQQKNISPETEAEKYISAEKEVNSTEDALQGAIDIIAEDISDDAELRKSIRKLYEKAAEYAKPEGRNILDLYCGAGTIGLSMAGSAKSIIGVEIIPEAIADAEFNARNNGISNAEFICGDATTAANDLKKRKIHPDTVIVDPPRKGCTPELIATITNDFSPERVVYVSCDPATLARDIKIFGENGYSLIEYTPVDLFPRTSHVETVAILKNELPTA